MPITQDRMIAMVDAAIYYRNALLSLKEDIKRELIMADQEIQTHQQANTAIGSLLEQGEEFHSKYETAVALEMEHFKRVRDYNKREAEKQRIKRNQLENPHRSSIAPYLISGKIAPFTQISSIPTREPTRIRSNTQLCNICAKPLSNLYCGMEYAEDVQLCPHQKQPSPDLTK